MKRNLSTRSVSLGSSKGVKISRLGRRTRSPAAGDDGPSASREWDTARVPNAKLPAQREANDEARRAYLEALPKSLRRAAELVAVDNGSQPDNTPMDLEYSAPDSVEATAVDPSHEGGEYFHFIDMADRTRKSRDTRTWMEAVSSRRKAWQTQMPALVDAYLLYKYGRPPEDGATSLHLEVIGLQEHDQSREVPNSAGADFVNQSLLYHGLLGCAPLNPSRAFPINTLEIYHRCRRRCPQLSIQQWIRVLCDIHNVTYVSILRDEFSDAFDTYLDILRRVQVLIDARLGRDTPNWRMLNSCPPCQYKLADEPPLEPAILGAEDGNNSLRRFRRKDRNPDMYEFKSDYFLPTQEVDQFKDEIKRRVKKDDKTNLALVEVEEEGDAADGLQDTATCTERWRAALADTLKGIYDAFDESGVFIAACRHGFIWIIADMMRSGELAKYPLAVVNKLLATLIGSLGLGYDIACSFIATINKSSLGARARRLGLTLAVPGFHGHAHNRLCAITHHVQVLPGFGLEDLETCERIFAASNGVARLTRHATRFHRRQFIDLHFRQWDEDKYENLGRFLAGNYDQALNILRDAEIEIQSLLSGRCIPETQYAKWLQEEREYIVSKQREPEEDVLGVEYVELLQKHVEAQRIWDTAQKLAAESRLNKNLSQRLSQASHDAWESVQYLQTALQRVEERLDIGERWTEATPAYQAAFDYMSVREYQRAVDHLEGLVVQRLFELTKANLSGTGYKQRTQMSKALQVRSKTIQRALKRYNAAALSLNPPRRTLQWQDIVEYGTLAEFELLRWGARQDIRNMEWTNSINRQAGVCYRKQQRAVDELKRLNVEIRRLATSIADEAEQLPQITAQVKLTEPYLGAALEEQVQRRLRVNHELQKKLWRIYSRKGFTGDRSTGRREQGTLDDLDPVRAEVPNMVDDEGWEDTDEGEEDDEDGSDEERERLWEGMSRLTLDT